MSSEDMAPTITARGLGKAYQVFARPEDRLKQMLFGGSRTYYKEFWALRDVDLDVYPGETVGIVGRNGSGKSTLLQILCGTLQPTTGSVSVRGRVAALLELGAGFNREFSGRDNVFLNGAILGFSKDQIAERYDRIAAFADIGPYIDQPVKTYSSGMYARLAFAVAIHVEPDILVIDEALSVGDEAFQRKCFGRIASMKEAGVTVLFVSHSAGVVVELCDRAILLDHGERLLTGKPKRVIARYQQLSYAPPEKVEAIRRSIVDEDATPESARAEIGAGQTATSGAAHAGGEHDARRAGRVGAGGAIDNSIAKGPGGTDAVVRDAGVNDGGANDAASDDGGADNGGANDAGPRDAVESSAGERGGGGKGIVETLDAFDPRIASAAVVEYASRGVKIEGVRIETPDGRRVNVLTPGQAYVYRFAARFAESATRVRFGMMIKTTVGTELGGLVTHTFEQPVEVVDAGTSADVRIPFWCRLAAGTYFLNAGVVGDAGGQETFLHRLVDAVMFKVMPQRGSKMTGLVDFGGAGQPIVTLVRDTEAARTNSQAAVA